MSIICQHKYDYFNQTFFGRTQKTNNISSKPLLKSVKVLLQFNKWL